MRIPMAYLFIATLSLITLVVSENSVEPMRKFTVDLDKPPEERWIDILSHYNSSVPAIVEYFDQEVRICVIKAIYSVKKSFIKW